MDNENVVQANPAAAEKKPNQIIRYAIMGVIGLIVLAVVISIIGALIPDKFAIRDGNSINWALSDEDQLVFVFNGKKMVEISDDLTEEIDHYESYYYVDTDYNQKYALFRTKTETDDDGEMEYGDLYVVNSKKYEKVAEEVSTYSLSSFGDTFLYIIDGDLYYGKLSNPTKASKIDTDVAGVSSVSPDGKAFAYYKYNEKKVEDEDGEEETKNVTEYYISTNGKKGEKFNKKDASDVMISDGAKYVYYVKDEKLYVNDTKIADSEEIETVMFNRDGSQILYSLAKRSDSDDDEATETKTYLIVKAGDKVAVGNGDLNGVICPVGAYGYSSGYYYNTASFAKCAVSLSDDGDTVYYYLKNVKGGVEKISALKNASSLELLDDGKTVLYTKSGNLRSINIRKPGSDPVEYTGSEEDVSSFDCTTDGKDIYVRDTDGTLYYVKSKTKMKKIKDDVSSYRVTDDGKVYFLNDDDELYLANKSDNAKRVVSDVTSLSYNYLADVVTVKADGQYGVVNGKKFKKLFVLN